MNSTLPQLYIIAGPNGAGKTTFAREFLPAVVHCQEFVNADYLAFGLAPFAPESAAFRAGRLMLKEIRRLSGKRSDFGFETTLSGKTYLPLLKCLKQSGYTIHLYFLWLAEVEIALARVADRVSQGGHSVPDHVVRRRFGLGLSNFFQLYRPLLDSWTLFDNSSEHPHVIACEQNGNLSIMDQLQYTHIIASIKK